MWKETTIWCVEWDGTNIWGQDCTGNKYFDNESEAKEFLEKVKQHEGINYICYKESTVMRKED